MEKNLSPMGTFTFINYMRDLNLNLTLTESQERDSYGVKRKT